MLNLEEVVVHNWDAARGAGLEMVIDPAVGRMIYDWGVLLRQHLSGSLGVFKAEHPQREREGNVSYLQIHFWPGGTEEQYGAMIKVLHPATGLPEGQRSHTSGPTEGGYLISVVWDSNEQSEAFMQNTLLPALPVKRWFAGRPEDAVAEVAHHDSL